MSRPGTGLPPIRHPQLGEPVAVYEYRRAGGDVAFVVCRFEPKTFRPAQLRGDRWAWHLEQAPVLPYRLPEIERALAAGDTVWIVDGEKDADALAGAGVAATCCARSQGWTIELAEQLTGARRVRVVADRDASGVGARQAREVADLLVRAGAVATVDVELVEAAEGKDPADHLAAGRRLDEFVPLSEETVEPTGGVRRRALADVQPRAVRFLVPGLVPLRTLTLVAGVGGLGKSTLALSVCRPVEPRRPRRAWRRVDRLLRGHGRRDAAPAARGGSAPTSDAFTNSSSSRATAALSCFPATSLKSKSMCVRQARGS